MHPDTPTSDTHVSHYKEHGYVVLSSLFSQEEISRWRDECNRLWREAKLEEENDRIHYREHDEDQSIADRFDPVIDMSSTFRELAHDDRIVDAVERCLGGDAQLMKDKLITKRPGTEGYGLHQDYPYWTCVNLPADSMLSVQVSIDAAGKDNGNLEVFPGLHDQRLEAPPGEPRDVDPSTIDFSRGEVIETQPGDLLLFHTLLPHRSSKNTSERNRRTLYFTYANTDKEDIYNYYYNNRPEY